MKTRIQAVSLILLFPMVLAAQQILRGRVKDVNTHRNVSGVNIYIKGSSLGTESSVTGEFRLELRTEQPAVLVFKHVGYNVTEIPVDSLGPYELVYLQPRVIPMQSLRVEAPEEKIDIQSDLPQAISIVQADRFAGKGFTDAGDLLKTDHSVQVDEELSGKKTVAIRAGNPDEVIVLYDYVPMNSLYNHQFDFSLVNLEDVKRVEIIKGSNTALYGSGSLAGIINVVPKLEQDYTLKFQQRIGTYRSGTWGLQFYRNLKGLHTSYSYRRGKYRRQFADVPDSLNQLENAMSQHLASLAYEVDEGKIGSGPSMLTAMFVRSALDYENRRDAETILSRNQLLSLRFRGDLYFIKDLNLSAAAHWLDEQEEFGPNSYIPFKDIDNRSYQVHAQKSMKYQRFEFLLGYEFKDGLLDYIEDQQYPHIPSQRVEARLRRNHHGAALITKYHAPTGYDFLSFFDVDASLRHDRIRDRWENIAETAPEVQKPGDEPSGTHAWDETMFKFAAHLRGNRGDLLFNAYLSYGKNVKFPTLFQQISTPSQSASPAERPEMVPERSRSTEVGFEFSQDIRWSRLFYGWVAAFNFFKNFYDNKFRTYYLPGIPVAFYDNVRTANITGLEGKSSIFLYRKKITVDLGYSRYFISEKAAFPFKYDQKGTLDVKMDHNGYAFQVHFFIEGEQVGWIREYSGEFTEVALPAHANMDLHFSKIFEIYGFKLMANFSIRNLFDDDVQLSGLALRDRRFYLTFAIQY
jgi:hypothetical protein